jgi:predicted dehydrogenase
MADRLGVGILGAGWITRAHAHAIRTLGHIAPLARPVGLTALAARNRDRGEAMARDLGIDRFSTDWAAVVNDPEVDVVANLMGASAHVEATEAALALGKPVLCE